MRNASSPAICKCRALGLDASLCLRCEPGALVKQDQFQIGDKVIVTAKSSWCEFIDGWRGVIERFDQGMAVVKVFDEGIDKFFYVPTGELAFTV